MATSIFVGLGEYLTTSYEPDCEWVDGELRTRHMGERPHASVQKFFMKYFLLREEELDLLVYAELRLQVSSTNFRVPDVMVMRDSDPYADVVLKAPLLCIEILSPEDRMMQMYEKVDDYLRMGVGCVWVIDPRRRCGFLSAEGTLVPTETLRLPGTPVSIAVCDAFAELDRLTSKGS